MEKGNELLTGQGDGLFMALIDFGAGPKCCQLPAANSQKMKKELFLGCVSSINHSSIQKS